MGKTAPLVALDAEYQAALQIEGSADQVAE
jgi:hypothetical protein